MVRLRNVGWREPVSADEKLWRAAILPTPNVSAAAKEEPLRHCTAHSLASRATGSVTCFSYSKRDAKT